jgi:hypothetical protein
MTTATVTAASVQTCVNRSAAGTDSSLDQRQDRTSSREQHASAHLRASSENRSVDSSILSLATI